MGRFTSGRDTAQELLGRHRDKAKARASERRARGSEQGEQQADQPGRRLARGHVKRAKDAIKAKREQNDSQRPGGGPPDHAPAHGYRRRHGNQGAGESDNRLGGGPPDHAPAHGYRRKNNTSSVGETSGSQGNPNAQTPGNPAPSMPPASQATAATNSDPISVNNVAANAQSAAIGRFHAGGYQHGPREQTRGYGLGAVPGYVQRSAQEALRNRR